MYALAVVNSALHVGGGFSTAGGVTARNIARWNGREWSALEAGVDEWVTALVTKDDALYAGGHFMRAGSQTANYIARWGPP